MAAVIFQHSKQLNQLLEQSKSIFLLSVCEYLLPFHRTDGRTTCALTGCTISYLPSDFELL